MEPFQKRSRQSLTKDRAYDLLFRHEMYQEVARCLMRLGVSEEDVPDVAQDAFLEAFRSFDSYDPDRARPERWMNMISVHVAAHYHDRASRRWEVQVVEDEEEESWPDRGPTVQEQIEEEQTRVLIMDCLSALEVHHCTILIEHDIDEIPMKEIAELHRLPVSTLYRWHMEAREALRDVLRRRIRAARSSGLLYYYH